MYDRLWHNLIILGSSYHLFETSFRPLLWLVLLTRMKIQSYEEPKDTHLESEWQTCEEGIIIKLQSIELREHSCLEKQGGWVPEGPKRVQWYSLLPNYFSLN